MAWLRFNHPGEKQSCLSAMREVEVSVPKALGQEGDYGWGLWPCAAHLRQVCRDGSPHLTKRQGVTGGGIADSYL